LTYHSPLVSKWPVFKEVDEIGNKPDEYQDEPCKIREAQPAEEDPRFKEIPWHPEYADE